MLIFLTFRVAFTYMTLCFHNTTPFQMRRNKATLPALYRQSDSNTTLPTKQLFQALNKHNAKKTCAEINTIPCVG
jgi:hypothetical protein